jgi:hypothetical protein
LNPAKEVFACGIDKSGATYGVHVGDPESQFDGGSTTFIGNPTAVGTAGRIRVGGTRGIKEATLIGGDLFQDPQASAAKEHRPGSRLKAGSRYHSSAEHLAPGARPELAIPALTQYGLLPAGNGLGQVGLGWRGRQAGDGSSQKSCQLRNRPDLPADNASPA